MTRISLSRSSEPGSTSCTKQQPLLGVGDLGPTARIPIPVQPPMDPSLSA